MDMSLQFGLPNLAKKTVLIERADLGGVCLNWGCIPTKALLRTAAHDDILVLLHSSEDKTELHNKLYGNMSDNSVKLYMEDLLFQFREGVPGYRFDAAMLRLIETAETLVGEGALNFDGKES